MGFATPSQGNAPASTNPDDSKFDFGLSGDIPTSPLGIFNAVCEGLKIIDSENFKGASLEFRIIDDEYFAGTKVGLVAPQLNTVPVKKRAGAVSQIRRLGDAAAILGLALAENHAPVEGWDACKGCECRIAVGEYNGKPSIIWGKPKAANKFPDEYRDDEGKHRDYGCGVLPME